MVKTRYSIFIALAFCGAMLAGCGVTDRRAAETGPPPMAPVSCIAVMPAAAMDTSGVVPVYFPEEENGRQAVQAMNEILSDELGGRDRIRFVGLDQISSLQMSGGESSLEFAVLVGERVGCNGVLESTVKRFSERVGGRYTVESPASVAFEMRLIFLDNSSVLWSAKFDETQKSVMENILELDKANTRGFTWITAEELMREGVREKLAASPYFKPVGN